MPQLHKFADSFKPVFRHHAIVPQRYGHMSLVLYFNEEDAPATANQIVNVSCASQATINKELGIDLSD